MTPTSLTHPPQTEGSVRRGLTAAEVEASRAKYGPNVLTPAPREPWWKLYLSKFDDPVIRILMIAAGLAIVAGLAEGKASEGVGIIIAIFLATFLSFWNEYRANREFDILNQTSDDVLVKVLRDGSYTTVPRRDIVVGDTVLVEVGEEIPADGQLIEAVSLLVNDAKLTGESKPVKKEPTGEQPAEPGTAYGRGQLLRGTTVVDGYGVYVVTAVGDRTEIGQTLRESTVEAKGRAPLKRQLADLSKVIGVVGFTVALITFIALVVRSAWLGQLAHLTQGEWLFATGLLLGVAIALKEIWLPVVQDALSLLGWQPPPSEEDNDTDSRFWDSAKPWLYSALAGLAAFALVVGLGIAGGWIATSPEQWLSRAAAQEFLRNFMIAVTIIVVAVPEGLAMSVTLSLAYSMRKMTATNNLVRRMDACETIGAATVICADKTGTLTLNEMRVFAVEFPGISPENPPAGRMRDFVIEAIAANTTAHLSREPGHPVTPVGNPTEGALLLWLEAIGADYIVARKAFDIRTQWTFTTERKFMATIGHSPVWGGEVLHMKGAPELLLERSTHVVNSDFSTRLLTPEDRATITGAIQSYQARGMRVLGFAYRHSSTEAENIEELAQNLTWLGFVAIADPIRPDVAAAVAVCKQAGVELKMITGDNSDTAKEIARQIGLWEPTDSNDRHMTGAEFAAVPEAEAPAAAERVKVISRARPAEKLRLVSLLRQRNHVVAVTGDGVNDGPALNHADVGLAMGKTGTAVAKEASDIILLDDSFQSIINAVRWGRALYENIQRFLLFQLTINVAALTIVFLGPFIGFELPLTVMQMLWVNLIMDTFAALALATEPPHDAVLQRPPRRPDAFIVTRDMAYTIFGVAAIFVLAIVGLIGYLGHENLSPTEPTWGGTVVFTVFVLLQFWNLFNAKCLGRSESVFVGLLNNTSFLLVVGIILLGQILIVQFGGSVFRTVPLDAKEWLLLLAGTSVVLWVGEGVRLVRRRLQPAKASAAPIGRGE
ncbi:MAG: calcium-translocating P-type ATPase, PMCA-type [Gemmataceae bacterium]|nr:calcium-translocating P-type ATPase, PMCA-type [Gemmata sp.]MDW8197414.1 calcium-translocating P-type ATPase, PMCA-type [Gemmataceae bacterium]